MATSTTSSQHGQLAAQPVTSRPWFKASQRALGRDWPTAYLFVLPTVLLLFALIGYPFLRALYLSFFNAVGLGDYALKRGEDTELKLEQSGTGIVVADAVKLVRDNSADTDDEKKTFNDVLLQAAAKATDQIRASEQKLADEFRKLGKTVVEVDRAAFRAAALPLHNDGSGGWSKEQYDALQALK